MKSFRISIACAALWLGCEQPPPSFGPVAPKAAAATPSCVELAYGGCRFLWCERFDSGGYGLSGLAPIGDCGARPPVPYATAREAFGVGR